MPCSSAASPESASAAPFRRSRFVAASHLVDYDVARQRGNSQRAAAEEAGVPRETARYWNNQRRDLGLPPAAAAFLETPPGQVLLHQIVASAVWVER